MVFGGGFLRGYRVLATLMLATVAILVAGGRASAGDDERQLWHGWVEIGGFYISDDASRGEAVVFSPLMHGQRDMLFADLRGKFFEDDVSEGNFALGYRRMSLTGFNFGAWVGVDIRNTEIDNTFHQLSGGFEALSHNFDARVNWYGPGTDAEAGAVGFTDVVLEGNNIFMIGGQEVMLQGVDGELGVRLPVEWLNLNSNQIEVRAYGGGFYFDDGDALEEVAGGRGRLVLAINDVIPQMPGSKLTAEYEYSYDDVREDRHEVGARLRIPFHKAPGLGNSLTRMSPQERRMMDGLERDTDIITVKSDRENVEDFLTDVDFDRVAFVNSGGSVTDTSEKAGANSLLIVNGTIVGRQRVQGDQTVQGGGSTIQVRGLKTGAVANFTAPGSRPTLTNGGGNIVRLLGDNTHIHGLLIDGQGTNNNGIRGGGRKTNIVIADNIIRNTGNDGIAFTNNNDNVRIFDNVITNAGDEGIDFDNRNTNITIAQNTVTGAGDNGIDFDDRNTNILIEDTVISGSGDDGLDLESRNEITISGTRIVNSSDDGISMLNRNVVSITNSLIDGAGDDGIQARRLNTISVANSTITNTSFGVFLFNRFNELTLSNVTMSNIGSDGLFIVAADNTLRVTNSIFTNIGDDVFDLAQRTTLLARDNRVTGTVGQDVFDFQGANSVVLAGSTGNTVTATVGDELCEGTGNFTGTLEINGTLFVNGATCN